MNYNIKLIILFIFIAFSSHSPLERRRRQPVNRDNPEPSRCLGVFNLSFRTKERDLFNRESPQDLRIMVKEILPCPDFRVDFKRTTSLRTTSNAILDAAAFGLHNITFQNLYICVSPLSVTIWINAFAGFSEDLTLISALCIHRTPCVTIFVHHLYRDRAH